MDNYIDKLKSAVIAALEVDAPATVAVGANKSFGGAFKKVEHGCVELETSTGRAIYVPLGQVTFFCKGDISTHDKEA
jgi:hypothetical protein